MKFTRIWALKWVAAEVREPLGFGLYKRINKYFPSSRENAQVRTNEQFVELSFHLVFISQATLHECSVNEPLFLKAVPKGILH